MDELAEKRVFADRRGASQLLVATSAGLAVVTVADSRVGEFGLRHREPTADVAVGGRRIAVATDDDVLLGRDVGTLECSGFGPASRISVTEHRVVAGGPEGQIGVYADGEWQTIGRLPGPPAAIDGDLLGTVEGVYRLLGDGLSGVGLDAVHDVAHVGGVPLAATATGLYELGNGWLDLLEGPVSMVAGTPGGRGHATTPETAYERVDGVWEPIRLPTDAPLVDVDYAERAYGVTRAGDVLIETADGWREEPLGLPEPRAVAVVDTDAA